MFADLIRRLTGEQDTASSDVAPQVAFPALLVRVARADGDYAESEKDMIRGITQRWIGGSPFEAAEVVREAEELEASASDTVRFTRAIKDAVAYEERRKVVEDIWRVVLADGRRDAEEDALMRLVANLLGVNDRDSNIARKAVEAGG
ncbi:MAG: TerB family tellurite resistance protein [Vannielia sp.]|uniref:tellurite resistance TerB family protein n=1 Tax=Rhodobacterales TaxID=204455 RepID=UPI002095D743|nr:TerB family tellurite resistance protein [Oceanicola sp. 502str15]MCO6382969.1 TerB family tellurite resistance protein [Oceanicola sp. 502str15]